MPYTNDLDRLRDEYANRKNRLAGKVLYSQFYPAYLFAIHQRQRALIKALKQIGTISLKGKRILEVGCGGGGVLLEYLTLGADPETMFGIDLLQDRLVEAHHKLPLSGISCADGQHLPFPGQSFDLVLQYSAFSSVLDAGIKQQMAADMLRVLRPGGAVIWYDFWLNPTNHQTRGIRLGEIRRMFQGCSVKSYKITLAPPIARRVVPISWVLAYGLETLTFLNSHFLAVIQK
ncbi:MAG TPA: class I SAM-dependent methyltransferase [Anaerolineaceae bacterium]|nr:class I SAM-dependent methyltransferase [Anaerolineaceae bacterium]